VRGRGGEKGRSGQGQKSEWWREKSEMKRSKERPLAQVIELKKKPREVGQHTDSLFSI